jgi:site-specific DNA recombinase
LVVVPSVEHLGESLRQQMARLLELDGLNCQVRCDNPEGGHPLRAMLKSASVQVAVGERRHAIREGMKAKAARGLGLGKPPYGYRIGQNGKLEPVADETEVVRSIFRMYLAEGMGVRSIARQLNDRGNRTRQGRAWSMVTVRDILRNSAYTGTYRRFGYRIPGSYQGIVPAEEFRRVQDRMSSLSPRPRHPKADPFLLTSIVYCGACGQRMMGVSRHRTWRRKSGDRARGEYRYYQCQSRVNRNQCKYHTRRAAELEEQVLELVRRPPANDADQEMERHGAPARPPRVVQAQLRALEKRYAGWVQRASDGLLPLRQLRGVLQKLEMERKALEEQLAVDAGGQIGWRERLDAQRHRLELEWDGLDASQRQQLLRSLVARVVVSDEKVEVLPVLSAPYNGGEPR